MIRFFIGFMIATIVALQVVLPVLYDAQASVANNTTATTDTVLGLLGLFVALFLLVAIASPLMQRM